jgi:hypothetical protein
LGKLPIQTEREIEPTNAHSHTANTDHSSNIPLKSSLKKMSSLFDPVLQFTKFMKSQNPFDTNSDDKGSLIQLKHIQSRPSGCAFLGAKAVSVPATLGSRESGAIFQIIIDSGADITLISDKTLQSLTNPPKKLTGCKVNLVQVTGSAAINSYVQLPAFFETEDGPVKLEVKAYVVIAVFGILAPLSHDS